MLVGFVCVGLFGFFFVFVGLSGLVCVRLFVCGFDCGFVCGFVCVSFLWVCVGLFAWICLCGFVWVFLFVCL